MNYTHYLLEKTSPVVKVIQDFEKTRQIEIDKIDTEYDKYKAAGYVLKDGLEALLFAEDQQPEGWKLCHKFKKHFEICEDTGNTQRYYHLAGQSKEAKEIRKRWRGIKPLNFRDFTQILDGVPNAMFGKGFQDGLTTRYAGFEKLKKQYVLLVPGHKGEQYIPEGSKELLNSEYLAMGGTL